MLQRASLDSSPLDGKCAEQRLRDRVLDGAFPRLAQRLLKKRRRGRVHRRPAAAELTEIREATVSVLFESLLAVCAKSRHLPPVSGSRFFSKATKHLPQKTLDDVCRELIDSGDGEIPIDYRSLDVRCLGSIYESLLNLELRVARPRRPSGRSLDGPIVELVADSSGRKSSGSYYTPPAIVEYLVANAVGPALDRKLEALLSRICRSTAMPPSEYPGFISELFDIKVVDPAMGCGHFLVEVAHFIARRLSGFLGDLPNGLLDAARLRRAMLKPFFSRTGSARLDPLGLSQLIHANVLERCVYGVDLDPFAVELAKAILWLDAGVPAVRRGLLDEHLRCGDALFGGVRIERPKRRFKCENRHPFHWELEFPGAFRPSGKTQPDATGFDCVVGNPPYVRIQNLDAALVEYLKASFETAVGKFDLYVPFLERGTALLRKDGHLGMIVPNKLLTSNYGAAFRRFAARDRLLRQIVDFGCEQVFPGASTYCCLLFLSRDASNHVTVSRGTVEPPIACETVRVPSERFGAASWSVDGRRSSVPAAGKPLKTDCRAIFQGLITGADRLLIGRREGDEIRLGNDVVAYDPRIFRPVLKGSDARRYAIRFSEHYVLYPYRQIDGRTELLGEADLAEHHPDTYRYLTRHRDQLENRGSATMVYPAWYAHWCPRSLARFESPKIVTQVLAARASFALDRGGTYLFVGGGNAGVYGILPTFTDENRVWLLLAILNSRAFDEQLQSQSSHFRGGYFSYARRFIENVAIPPVATIDLNEEPVPRIIKLAKQRAEGPPDCHNRLETEIDGAVDELYRCGIR